MCRAEKTESALDDSNFWAYSSPLPRPVRGRLNAADFFVNYGNQKTKTVDSRDSVSQSVPSLLQIDANFKLRVFLSHIWILGSADLCCTHTSLSCDPSVRNLHRTGMNEKYLHLFVRNYRSRFYSYFSPRNWCSAHCGIRCNVIGFFSDWNSWLERKIENLWIDRTNSKAM